MKSSINKDLSWLQVFFVIEAGLVIHRFVIEADLKRTLKMVEKKKESNGKKPTGRKKRRKEQRKFDYVVAYSNELNDFPLERSSTKQYDLFWVIIGRMRNQGTNTLVLSGKDLRKIINFKGPKKRFNTMVEKLTHRLMGTTVRQDRNNNEWLMRPLFAFAKYNLETEDLTLSVSEESAKYFNNLTSNFTMWYQKTLLDLDTVYSKTLFRKLSQFANTGKYMAKFEDFLRFMSVPPSYKPMDVKPKIIQPSLLRLMPYFKNLNCTYKKAGKSHKLVGVTFTFDKFESSQALDKGIDKSQCLANIRTNPNFTDEEKWQAEDIFLQQKSGTAKTNYEQRKKSGLGLLDDIIDPSERNGVGKEIGEGAIKESESSYDTSPASNLTSLDITSEKIASVKSKEPVKATHEPKINSSLLKVEKNCEKQTLPLSISILDGYTLSVPGDPLVEEWISENFFIKVKIVYESVPNRANMLKMLNLPENKKSQLVLESVLSKDWWDTEEDHIPYDPVLRLIWGKLSSRDASLLADVYKHWQNNGHRLTMPQKHDEQVLRTLSQKLDMVVSSVRSSYPTADKLMMAVVLNNWDQLRGWDIDVDDNRNLVNLTLESTGISAGKWPYEEPKLEKI